MELGHQVAALLQVPSADAARRQHQQASHAQRRARTLAHRAHSDHLNAGHQIPVRGGPRGGAWQGALRQAGAHEEACTALPLALGFLNC